MTTKIDFYGLIVFLSLIGLIVWVFTGMPPAKDLDDLAKESLRKQKSITRVISGKEAKAIFSRGPYKNRVVVTWGQYSVSREDINKSRIVGEAVADKTKEVAKGFFRGLFKGGKHD